MANKIISRSLLATAAWLSLSTPQASATSIYDLYDQYYYDGGVPVWSLPANDNSRSFGKKIYDVNDGETGTSLLKAVRQDGAVLAGGGAPVGLMSSSANGADSEGAPDAGTGAGTESGEGTGEGVAENTGNSEAGSVNGANEGGTGTGNTGSGLTGLPTLDGSAVDLDVSGGAGEGIGAGGPLYTWSPYPVFLWAGSSNTTGSGETGSASSESPVTDSEAGTQSGEPELMAFSICTGSECEEMLSDPSATLAFEAACVDNVGCTVTENEVSGEPVTVAPMRPVLLDKLTVVTASDVPEPETYALFAAGLALIAVRRLRAS